MGDYLISLDSEVFLWLNSHHAHFWDFFMKTVTGKLIWGGMYLSILFALYKAFGLKVMFFVFIGTCIAVLFADQVTASLLRPWLSRLRPAHPDNPISELVHIVDGKRGGPYGFPSSHAANTFAVATLLSYVFKNLRFTIGIFIWALLNCYSRIYLGMHYPGDLIVGSIIGFSFGLLIWFLIKLVFTYLSSDSLRRQNPDYALTALLGNHFKIFPSDIVLFIEFLTLCGVCLAYLLIY